MVSGYPPDLLTESCQILITGVGCLNEVVGAHLICVVVICQGILDGFSLL
jgi:hypothetical protein